MRKVILYVAVSLDGYIADAQKSVHWIKGQDDSAEMLDTYTPFFASVDTVIMGSSRIFGAFVKTGRLKC